MEVARFNIEMHGRLPPRDFGERSNAVRLYQKRISA
jgi:hypothetical protein